MDNETNNTAEIVNTKSTIETNKPYKMDQNMEAAFAYILTPITGFVVYHFEKENKFIRFHAMQSIVFGIASVIALTIADALVAVFIGIILSPIVTMVVFGLWLFLMWKAYNNEEFELPFLGQIVRDILKPKSK
ncbi:MAG: DUF4870 domain-containing protein [Patescibacteria group bacterium]